MNKKTGVSCALFSFLISPGLSSAFDLSIALQAGSEVFSQLSGKLVNKVVDGEGYNLTDEYNKFQAKLDAADPAYRDKIKAQAEAEWRLSEEVYLRKNAQIKASDDLPLIDLQRVAGAGVKGIAQSFAGGMGGVATLNTTGAMTDMIGYSAINGVGDALSGSSQSTPVHSQAFSFANTYPGANSPLFASVTAKNAVSDATTKTSSNVATKLISSFTGKSDEFKFTKIMRPDDFFGKSPNGLQSGDLYSLNGYYGFRRVVNTDQAQVYQFVQDHPTVVSVTYLIDPQTKAVVSAFKDLKGVSVLKFKDVVDAVSKEKQSSPIYASNENSIRAIWNDGSFVAADQAKVMLGWSKRAIEMYGQGTKVAQQ